MGILALSGAAAHSMIEEAAGTRLFEQKKEAAQKTIEKKARKVEEISTVRRRMSDSVWRKRACMSLL